MRNSIGNIIFWKFLQLAETLLVVNVILGILCHGLYRLYRIFSGSGLSGKHDRTGSIINCICNIRCFRSGRTRIFHHGIQHLCCCDNNFSCIVHLFNDQFLDGRNFLNWDFYTHISSGNHDAIRDSQNFINVIHTLTILNLSKNLHVIITMFAEKITKLNNIICTTDKGCCHKIKALFHTENKIVTILFTDIRHCKFSIWNVNSLMVGHHTSVFHFTYNIRIRQFFYTHFNQTIIDQNTHPRLYILHQILVSDGCLFFISSNFSCSQCKHISRIQLNLIVFKIPKTNLRSACIEQ